MFFFKWILCQAPLGSIPELPADSCKDIKASEGDLTISGYYWLDSTRSGNSLIARCDMQTENKWDLMYFIANLPWERWGEDFRSTLSYSLFINVVADYCIQHQCLNTGTCENNPGGYTCACNPSWFGDRCELGIYPFGNISMYKAITIRSRR